MHRLVFAIACVAPALAASAATLPDLDDVAWSISANTAGTNIEGPNTNASLTDANRGIAFNPVTKNVLVAKGYAGGASGALSSIFIYNGTTGANVGSLNMTGVNTGASRVITRLGVADDGAIYAANLVVNMSAATPGNSGTLRIYKWADESAVPVEVFTSGAMFPPVTTTTGTTVAARAGDSFDVRGSGADTQFVLGHGFVSNAAAGGTNRFAILNANDVTASSFTASLFQAGSNGDFRQGLAFGAGDSIYSKEVGDLSINRYTFTLAPDVATAGGSFSGPAILSKTAQLAIDPIDGLMATIVTEVSTSANPQTAHGVRLFDLGADPTLAPTLLDSANFADVFGAGYVPANNLNGAGQLDWGTIDGRKYLYVVIPNNGVVAFRGPVIPEPATAGVLAATALLAARRRGR
jgi:hypothetical protein